MEFALALYFGIGRLSTSKVLEETGIPGAWNASLGRGIVPRKHAWLSLTRFVPGIITSPEMDIG
jgi:hypothetical protein